MNYLKKIIPFTITLALFFVLPIKGQTTDENHSLSFDGADDYVSIADNNSVDIADQITIMAMVKANDWTDNFILAKRNFLNGEDTNYQLSVSVSYTHLTLPTNREV